MSCVTNDNSRAKLGELVKQARLKRNLSQSEFAKFAKISTKNLIHIETGSGDFYMKDLSKLIKTFELPIQIVFEEI